MIATSLLTACATGGSDPGGAVCPPVVVYDQAVRDRAAAELEEQAGGVETLDELSNGKGDDDHE